ncbi:MAG: hypothetical protein KGI50_04930 [Patescibacteria group bacterium]|nr:hypothetical protein [Patescibacteria group bacterium]MDE2438616.1 hypothetical protein [Patescibacteria group bacterium]
MRCQLVSKLTSASGAMHGLTVGATVRLAADNEEDRASLQTFVQIMKEQGVDPGLAFSPQYIELTFRC